jgi:hypothetical protein
MPEEQTAVVMQETEQHAAATPSPVTGDVQIDDVAER